MGTILNCILVGWLASGAAPLEPAAAGRSDFLPLVKTLPQEELRPLVEKWDASIANDRLEEKSKALYSFAKYIPDRHMRFYGVHVLGYTNREVVDRVVDLYLREYAKATLPPPAEGVSETNPWYSNDEGEYLTCLLTLAESSFDPRIYKTELNPPGGMEGDLRMLYLASVNPETTLAYLLECRLGQRVNGKGNPDYFYHGEVAWGMSVVEAFQVLSFMSVQSPDVLRRHRTDVLSFVRHHVKHYAFPRSGEDYGPKPVYLKVLDYDVRNPALDVLGLLATPDDIAEVEDVMANPPVMAPEQLNGGSRNRREQIQSKGDRIIGTLRGQDGKQR
jgi:hypothetical protein